MITTLQFALLTLAQETAELPPPDAGNGSGLPEVNPWAGLLMAAGAMLLMFLVMMNLRRKISARHEAKEEPRERIERVRQANGMQNDLRQMMVELEDLTRRFGSQLDARSAKLEALIEEADAKIAQLQRLSGKPGAAAPAAAPRGPKTMGKGKDLASGESVELPAAAEPEELDPLSGAVYKLADQGKKPPDIARELGEHIGKVELILALRQQRV